MINTIPLNDWIEHEESTSCPCEPTLEIINGEMLVTHNALDGRERYETCERCWHDCPHYMQCHDEDNRDVYEAKMRAKAKKFMDKLKGEQC